MPFGPPALRPLGCHADYLIMAASNQVINVFNTNALQNQIPVDPNVLSPGNSRRTGAGCLFTLAFGLSPFGRRTLLV